MAGQRKKKDENFNEKYTNNNVNLDELDKKLNDNIITLYKKIYFNLIRFEFVLALDNIFTSIIQTKDFYDADISNINKTLLYDIFYYTASGYKFCNIKQMSSKTNSDRCNITYEYYMKLPMNLCQREINFIIAKNPSLINLFDRSKNHQLIRKYFSYTI